MFFYDANPSCAVTDGLKHFISSLFCLTLVYHQCSLPDCLTLNKIVTKKKNNEIGATFYMLNKNIALM